jgi:ribosomal protein L11 methylase PrmA
VRTYPAIDVGRPADSDLLVAAVDDFGPIAVEERDATLRIFFSTSSHRDQAYTSLGKDHDLTSIDVPDEDWARRSQENLQPVTVGRIIVAPPWSRLRSHSPVPRASARQARGGAHSPVPRASARQARVRSHSPLPSASAAIFIVVSPSMGFGTGHHATTRLCLAAMQEIAMDGAFVLDVGTGSGVLAITADVLGASRALGVDNDPDAIQSAIDNLALNPAAVRTTFELADLTTRTLPVADIVTANLTGALLVRSAPVLGAAVRQGGALILSGLLQEEREEVREAFGFASVVWEGKEDGWGAIVLRVQS